MEEGVTKLELLSAVSSEQHLRQKPATDVMILLAALTTFT